MEYTVQTPMKALEALRQIFPDSSRRTLQNWLKGGRFSVDHTPMLREDAPLEPGQVVRSKQTFAPKQSGNVKIIYEDRSLIAIEKPIGLLSVPLDGPSTKASALEILRTHYRTQQIYAVHRIDRETTGVLLFARGTDSEQRFKDLFERHDLRREYFAVVEGRLAEDKGTWRCILKETQNYDVEISHDDGREAITHFEVLKRSSKYTYLRLLLETGRKHQIRVHCKEAGCPVLGDDRYGAIENPIQRLALHARSISFVHPFTKKRLTFTSPLPFAFKKLGATDELFKKAASFDAEPASNRH